MRCYPGRYLRRKWRTSITGRVIRPRVLMIRHRGREDAVIRAMRMVGPKIHVIIKVQHMWRRIMGVIGHPSEILVRSRMFMIRGSKI
jgi:hypothetical protein